MSKKLIPCAGQEPNKLGVVPPLARIRKILAGLTPAHAHSISVRMEAESAEREYSERQCELRLRHDH